MRWWKSCRGSDPGPVHLSLSGLTLGYGVAILSSLLFSE
jgi:hypothetical protein